MKNLYILFILILVFGIGSNLITSHQESIENNTEHENIQSDISNDVSSNLRDNLSKEYDARNYKEFRSDVKKFTDNSKNLDDSYYDYKVEQINGYSSYSKIKALYDYMPNTVDTNIMVTGKLSYLNKDNYGNISAILEDEGDQVTLFFYNNNDEKSKEVQYALNDAYSNNCKIDIFGTFQENPTDLGTYNVYVHSGYVYSSN